MSHAAFHDLARQLLSGELSPTEFAHAAVGMKHASQEVRLEEEAATIDIDRQARCGFPEVVFAEGKSVRALRAIAAAHLERGEEVFATRLSAEKAAELQSDYPTAQYNAIAHTWRVKPAGDKPKRDPAGHVAVI